MKATAEFVVFAEKPARELEILFWFFEVAAVTVDFVEWFGE